MTKYKRTSKRVKHLTSEWNQKYQHLSPYASMSLLCIRFVAVAFWYDVKVSWRKEPPVTYFCPALDLVKKTTTLVRDNEYFIPTKFHQNPSIGSGEEVENVKVYGRRRTDGRRTGRYDNSSLEPSAQLS